MSDRFRDALKSAWRKIEEQEWIYGTLGRKNSDGTFTFVVPGRPTFVFVTIRNATGAQTVVPARNDAGVPHSPRLPVRMKLEHGNYVIYAKSGAQGLANLPAQDPYGLVPHSTSHKHGGTDEVGTATPGANAVIKADADGKIGAGWLDPADVGDVGASINAAATDIPLDADKFVFWDVVDLVVKSITWANIKATLLTYFSTIFAVLAGTAGGQSLSGGNAANDDLTLQGTAHATRTTSYTFLEPNGGRVSVGGVTPHASTVLDIGGTERIRQFLYASRNLDALTAYLYMRSREAAEAGSFGNPFGNGAGEFASSGLAGLVLGTRDATPLAFGTNDIERMRILPTGEVGIGTTTPDFALDVEGSSGSFKFNPNGAFGAYAIFAALGSQELVLSLANPAATWQLWRKPNPDTSLYFYNGAERLILSTSGYQFEGNARGKYSSGLDFAFFTGTDVEVMGNAQWNGSAYRRYITGRAAKVTVGDEGWFRVYTNDATDVAANITWGDPRLTIDNRGTMAFGTTDIEAWSTLYPAIALGGSSGIMASATTNGLYILEALYYDGAFKRKNATNAPLLLAMTSSGFNFYADPTGAADSTYTLFPRFSILPSGFVSVRAGESLNDAAVGGVLVVNTTQTGNVGTGEDVLASYSIPADTLDTNGQSIWFEAWGTTANNANAKRLRVRFGTAGTNLVVDNFLALNDAGTWHVRGRVTRTGAATQRGFGVLTEEDNTAKTQSNLGLNQTLSGAVTFQISGEATSNNDIVIQNFVVGWDDANT